MKNTAVVSSKGQIVIPSALRKRYKLDKGTTVVFQEEGGRLIMKPNNYAKLYALRGSLAGYDLEGSLMADREAERRREDSR
jgi:AbrB family looped-hinge helix DNA binding protein